MNGVNDKYSKDWHVYTSKGRLIEDAVNESLNDPERRDTTVQEIYEYMVKMKKEHPPKQQDNDKDN